MKLYICPKCHTVIEKILGDDEAVFCCEEEMQLLKEEDHSGDETKHTPSITCKKDTLHIVVGEVVHPMDEKHYIQFVSVEIGDYVLRKDFEPNSQPSASFHLQGLRGKAKVYTYCNIHGLWKYEIEV